MSTIVLRCNRECIDNTFAFGIELNIKPKNDSLHVGDTLWVESYAPVKLMDMVSNTGVLFDHANLISTSRFGELMGPGNMVDAVSDFEFIALQGNILSSKDIPVPNRTKWFQYTEESEMYKLSFGIICKTPGIYDLTLSDGENAYSPRHGSCGRASILFKFSNDDKHIKYLQDTYYKGYVIPDAVVESSYCFRVF
jgi:hypothetical protein